MVLSRLLADLRVEHGRPGPERPTRANDAALDHAIAVVERAQRVGLAAVAPDARVLARVVGDGWSYRAPLSVAVLEFARHAERAASRAQ